MDTVKSLLLTQFAAAYDENGWFVALKNALADLTAEQAAWKPEHADNSIRETLAHLNYYNFAYLERFKGVDYVYPAADNDATFAGGDDVSEDSWRAELENFDRIMTDWRALIEAAPEEKFDAPVSATNRMPWAELLSHVVLHNAHHGGQIVLLRKLQGSWDRAKGVS
jgi:uncharacterized damage-inducible protein DinB